MAGAVHTNDLLSKDISDLKALSTCKIIRNVGEFTHVVNVTIPDTEAVVKFQITAEYPRALPTIFIRHPNLSKDVAQRVITEAMADSPTSLSVIFSRITSSPSLASLPSTKGKCSPRSLSKRNQKKSSSPDSSSDEKSSKKPSMKTAAAVVKRIQWDPSLSSERFTVGYIDRFTGIQEQPFHLFNWVNPAEAEWDDLNIPEHRIEYFKFDDHIVWEKKSRTDNVFGSTGGTTIDLLLEDLNLSEPRAVASNPSATITIGDNDDDSDDDDGVQVKLSVRSLATGNPLSNSNGNPNLAVDNSQTNTSHQSRPVKHDKPNHFIALPITSQHVIDAARSIQRQYAELSELDVSRYETEGHNLHITLCAVRINNEDDLDTVNQILYETVLDQSVKINKPFNFEKMDTFWNRVLFVSANFDESFHQFVIFLRRELKRAGIRIFDDDCEFVPHMTLLKFPKSVNVSFLPVEDFFKLRGGNSFTKEIKESKLDGEDMPLQEIQLLSMERDTDNRYIRKFSVDIE